MKIVVLDDAVDNLNLLKLYVKKSEDEFVFYSNCDEAIAYFKDSSADIFFLDIQMPEMDGFEVLEVIRELPQRDDLFVCALSAFSLDMEADKIKNSSFNDYIQKPILRQNFLDYIESKRK